MGVRSGGRSLGPLPYRSRPPAEVGPLAWQLGVVVGGRFERGVWGSLLFGGAMGVQCRSARPSFLSFRPPVNCVIVVSDV